MSATKKRASRITFSSPECTWINGNTVLFAFESMPLGVMDPVVEVGMLGVLERRLSFDPDPS